MHPYDVPLPPPADPDEPNGEGTAQDCAPSSASVKSLSAQPAENPTLCQPVAPSGTTSVRTVVWV